MITDEMVRTKTPGLSVAIIEGEKIVYSNGFGARDLKGDKPATQDTFYLIASTTKSFICVAIMKLQEEGKLSIEDPVSKHLPFELGLDGYPILIRHLMSHQSGVPSLDDNIALSEFAKEMDYQFSFPSIPYTSWGDYFRFINSGNEFVLEPPSKKFHYLNTGFTMLGRIIEVVSRQPLTDFMGEHILLPLEMKKSSFLEEDFKNDDSLSLAYKTISKNKKQFIQEARYVSDKFGYAAGGLFCSVVEMANYTIMNLNGGIFNGKQIISKESLNQIHDFQFTESYPSTDMTEFYGNYGKTGYGFGWAVHDDFYGHKLIHHSGSWLGASAWHALIPELKLGVVMLANKHPSPRIFAQAIMFVPLTLAGFTDPSTLQGFMSAFTDFTGFWYNFTFFVMIILFTYFYTAITINPNQMAEDMKKNGGFIPGVKPGKQTADFLDSILSKITLPGSFFLGLVAILPAFAMIGGVNSQFAQFYGGTSLL
ncbi:MAG: serine hydrolase, partial [Candidatus Heimdallarchaeota archaeon]|nr:serine hydrolase [Candidatus Heimdallarchaeota archaeon]